MIKRYRVVLIICMMLLISTTSISVSTKKISSSGMFYGNDADIPEWNIGDTWVYNMHFNGDQGSMINFDLDIENFKMEVIEKNTFIYKLEIGVPKGYITGSGTVSTDEITVSGSLKNTMLYGYMLVNRTNLAIIDMQATIGGFIDKLIDIPFTIGYTLTFQDSELNQNEYSAFEFPLTIGNYWLVPFKYVEGYMDVSLLPEPSYLLTFIDSHSMACIMWDTITVNNKEYDALQLEGSLSSNQILYYAPSVGNIVKVDFEDVELGYGYRLNKFTMDLISTTYEYPSSPPATPSVPNGPTDLVVGETATYQTVSYDPDSDEITYIFDWGDGTTTSSDFVESGQSVNVEHIWMQKGTYEVKVKARDKYGKESSWSNPITVIITNNAPLKPDAPEGKIKGNYKQIHTYTATSTDPDDHKISYLFDWGDGTTTLTDLYDSGDVASADHKWSSQGTYEVKVKAIDEYNEESDWSDSTSVAMPKLKNRFFNIDAPQIFENYPLLEKIFSHLFFYL